eukprot:348694-Prorocentrum_minimum.AAC.1
MDPLRTPSGTLGILGVHNVRLTFGARRLSDRRSRLPNGCGEARRIHGGGAPGGPRGKGDFVGAAGLLQRSGEGRGGGGP